MDIEQLQAFLTVVQTKNFTRAAELLHVTQSTVTARIKALESRFGKQLLTRSSRRVEMTPLGQSVYEYARRIVELMNECELAAQLEQEYEERFVIGSVHSLWDYVLAPVVRSFRQERPKTALRLLTGHSEEIVEAVLDQRADAGILYVPPRHPDMEVIPLYEDDIRLVAHPSFLPAKQPLTAAALASLPLLYLDWGAPFTQWFEAEAGRQFLPGLQVDHASLMMRYLLDGGGIGFVLQSVCQQDVDAGRLQVVAYAPRFPVPRHTVYLVYLKRSGQQETLLAWSRFLQERVGKKGMQP